MYQEDFTSNKKNHYLFTLVYCFFIIYGSLVPLEFKYIPLQNALSSFKQIPYLNINATSRADWVSNIVLYIPFTFSLSFCFLEKNSRFIYNFFNGIIILLISLCLAITLEFFQQFFPPRTVSQNDLIAEFIGSILGIVLWILFYKQFKQIFTKILLGGRNSLIAITTAYTIIYLVLCFFPYDFVTSFQELQDKFIINNSAFFISSKCGGLIICSSKLTAEILLFIPVGILLSLFFKWHPRRLTTVIFIGFLLGLIIEGIQLFIISGISQGFSILTRTIGAGIGELIYRNWNGILHKIKTIKIRKSVFILIFPYLYILSVLNGGVFSEFTLSTSIFEKFQQINWLPFYYHYYTSETVALTSLIAIFLMYLPIGFFYWLWSLSKNLSAKKMYWKIPALLGFITCSLIELGKLFVMSLHPDPTNILIATISAVCSYICLLTFSEWFSFLEKNS